MLFSPRVGGNLISVGFGEDHASAISVDMIKEGCAHHVFDCLHRNVKMYTQS